MAQYKLVSTPARERLVTDLNCTSHQLELRMASSYSENLPPIWRPVLPVPLETYSATLHIHKHGGNR